MDGALLTRLGLIVHPRRELNKALDTLQRWSDEHGVDVVQVPAAGQDRTVADPGDPADCDVIIALGGDGTTLAALRTGAAAGRPVMGVACGSLGALTAVTADDLGAALDRLAAGDWTPRPLPALAVESDGSETWMGVNDVVVVRQGAGQISADVHVDGELFIRFAGDGLVAATPLGSSAYTLAARCWRPAAAGSCSRRCRRTAAAARRSWPPRRAASRSLSSPAMAVRGSSSTARSTAASSRTPRAR
jgi:NAD+ kinase